MSEDLAVVLGGGIGAIMWILTGEVIWPGGSLGITSDLITSK